MELFRSSVVVVLESVDFEMVVIPSAVALIVPLDQRLAGMFDRMADLGLVC